MAEQNTQLRARRWPQPDGWTIGAGVIALIVLAPIVSVVWIAFHPTENIWPHLLATVMPRYMMATLTLMAGVGVLTALVGTGAAWLVTIYRFPGSGWLSYALLFPLAVPAYVGAYALVDFFDYSGALQVNLRSLMGWASSQDYWFPKVRTPEAAILVLSAALYPYVYLLARQAFREQSGGSYEVARALGSGAWGVFLRVGLPLARPSVAAGVALALMETVADYGTVAHFGVQTLTTGIFTTWLTAGNAGGAAQIAGVSLSLIVLLLTVERLGRRRARFHASARQMRPVVAQTLSGWRGWLAFTLCFLPFAMGFLLPVAVMASHALKKPEAWIEPGLGKALMNTLTVGGCAAVLTVAAAIFFVYGLRMAGRGLPRWILPVTALGYAAPGAVLALGLLVPLAALDHRVADGILALTGHDPGLMLTGTSTAIVLAFIVRFFGIAQGAVDAAFGRISPNLPLAARALGRPAGGVLREVYLPLMRGSVGMALLIVFVDCVKELPATLLLRPFNFNTLATRTQELASLEKLGEAAPAALLVMAVGLVAVALMARMEARR
ncbi:ABC transporter permease [Gemmobacter serpentinus]|uniref:ABC transporter permease n=1 Tax=Gemmobacter serpentinus TaxID=2652247 RepID=UPI00124D45E3|nr:iron ABC transporter permease [Gemmobacter serpentinus]